MAEDIAWVKIEDQTSTYGRFVASPLKKGFGNTLGNSLRRVLLSALEGTAMTAVKIEGIDHEFATLDNMKEDILDIIMNLKGVVYKTIVESDGPVTVSLAAKKEGTVTAAEITTGSDIELVNKEHYIASLSKSAKLNIDITLDKGVGYLPVDIQQKLDIPIGTIPLDVTFSPVIKVNYTVDDFRVGKKIDYDKLTMEIWTNGSINPAEALAKSSEILQKELVIFMDMDKKPEQKAEPVIGDVDAKQVLGLKLTIEDLELSARSYNCLRKAGIEKVSELIEKDIKDLMKIKNFGKKSSDEINDKLKQYNLALKGEIEEDN